MHALRRPWVGPPTRRAETIDELKRRAPPIARVVASYLGQPDPATGHHRCPFHADKTGSWATLASRGGREPDHGHCFGCGWHGDVVDFLQHHVCGGDLAAALALLAQLAGDSPRSPEAAPRPPPGSSAAGPSSAPAGAPAAASTVDGQQQQEAWKEEAGPGPRQLLAQDTWRDSEAIPAGPPTDYLTGRRGILSWDPDRLRWHPECPWKLGADDEVLTRAGCILAPVTCWRTGHVVAIWRIRPSLSEPMDRRRMGLGPSGGNAARLFPADPEDELAVAEGVETALAYAGLSGVPTWSALNAGNMAKLMLPERHRLVTVVQDHDVAADGGPGPGPIAARALVARLRAEGRAVRLLTPELPGDDANDLTMSTTPRGSP